MVWLVNAERPQAGSYDQASEEERKDAIMDALSLYIAIEGPTTGEATEGPTTGEATEGPEESLLD